MGIVSRAEGDAAAQIAATTEGVARVVKVFEYTTDLRGEDRRGSRPAPRYPAKIATPRRRARAHRALPRPLVFTNGVFDVLHRGHVTYLDQARALGASLVVAVNTDASVRRLGKGDDRPLNPLDDRMAVLAALAAVDLVVPFDDDTPRELIVACLPDVLVKGGDYTADDRRRAEVARGGASSRFRSQRSTSPDRGGLKACGGVCAEIRCTRCTPPAPIAKSTRAAQLPAADPAHEEGAERHAAAS